MEAKLVRKMLILKLRPRRRVMFWMVNREFGPILQNPMLIVEELADIEVNATGNIYL